MNTNRKLLSLWMALMDRIGIPYAITPPAFAVTTKVILKFIQPRCMLWIEKSAATGGLQNKEAI